MFIITDKTAFLLLDAASPPRTTSHRQHFNHDGAALQLHWTRGYHYARSARLWWGNMLLGVMMV